MEQELKLPLKESVSWVLRLKFASDRVENWCDETKRLSKFTKSQQEAANIHT